MTRTSGCGEPRTSSCGSGVEPQADGLFGGGDLSQTRVLRRDLRFLVAAAILCATNGLLFVFGGSAATHALAIALALVGVSLGYPLAVLAAKAVRRLRFNTEVFITLAVVTVLLIHNWWYASWVVTVMWLGETLMAWAGLRARSSVEGLLKLVPRRARVVTPSDDVILVPVEQVKVGQLVAVHPGESIPVDGVVVRGETTVDQSMLTGESLPVDVGVGEQVFAGTHNLVGAVQVRTEAVAEENTVAQIVTMMRKAQTQQIPIPRAVDTFIRWYFPLALVAGVVMFAVTGSLERMAAILLVLAPCAFSAATPLALVATIGNAARYGIMIKNGPVIEALPRAGVALLDKTGTLTTSTPMLNVIESLDGNDNQLLALAASAESVISSHPLARAVLDAAGERGLGVSDPDAAEVVSGNGVVATCDGHRVAVGNGRFMWRSALRVPVELEQLAQQRQEEGHTLAYVAVDGKIQGFFGFLAVPRPAARSVVDGLRRFGFRHVVMLTGDHSRPAAAIADRLGLEVVSEASPQAKLDEVARWKAAGGQRPNTVLMVGDGINDAGALAAADVGVAMATAGADVAASAADIVIHGDQFGRVLTAAKLARHGHRMIRLNIGFATTFNIVGITLASLGLVTPLQAQLIGMLSFFSVVFNSVFVLLYRPRTVEDRPVVSWDEREQPTAGQEVDARADRTIA